MPSPSQPSIPSNNASGSAPEPSLALPSWFTQSVEQVAEATRAEAHELKASYEDGDLLDVIRDQLPLSASLVDERVNQAAKPYPWPFSDDVMEKAFPKYSEQQRDSRTTNQKNIAMEAVRLLVAAAVWRMIPTSQEVGNAVAHDATDGGVTAAARVGTAEDLLRGLIEGVEAIVADVEASDRRRAQRGVILIGRGDYSGS